MATDDFHLLSIGHRGVGKTVFLAGSYAQLDRTARGGSSHSAWFECDDEHSRQDLDKILNYVARTGQYPPLTLKITDFRFALKQAGLFGTRTRCHFHWKDVPGEICRGDNPDFQPIVLGSHGCCVFLDAGALVGRQDYLAANDEILRQVGAIASLVHLNRLDYAFAVVLTKCDLLPPGTGSEKLLGERLAPICQGLDRAGANYRVFRSGISIGSAHGPAKLKAQGSAEAILWLVGEVSAEPSWLERLGLLRWFAPGAIRPGQVQAGQPAP